MTRTRRTTMDRDQDRSDFDSLFDHCRRRHRRSDIEVDRWGNIIDDDQLVPRALAEPVGAELEPRELEAARPSPQERGAAQALTTSPEPNLVEPTSCPCLWCGCPFEPRKDGGSSRRFCSTSCRRALDQASRAWVRRQIDAGLLSVADLQSGVAAACALPQEANEHPDVVGLKTDD
jgi:hypothetical protein